MCKWRVIKFKIFYLYLLWVKQFSMYLTFSMDDIYENYYDRKDLISLSALVILYVIMVVLDIILCHD